MNNKDMSSIFEQINNLKKPDTASKEKNTDISENALREVLNTVSDTSDISTHIFAGQFYKWTIQLELQDGFLFSIPQKSNWRFVGYELSLVDKIVDPTEEFIEISETFETQ